MMKVEIIHDGQASRKLRGTSLSHASIEGGNKISNLGGAFPKQASLIRLVGTLAGVAAALFSTDSSFAASAVATVGQSVALSVTADGTAPFSYQWKKNGTTISSATTATYTLNSVSTTDSGDYSVVVLNVAGSTTSDIATISVNAAVIAPSINSQPTAVSVNAGQSAAFSVGATGSGVLSYQWKKNGTAISGATSATYTIATTASGDAGSYSVVVTNSAGSATSNAVTLSILVAPSITGQPGSLTVISGQSASFTVAATGSATMSYQWKKSGASISGATSATFTIASATSSDVANYSVVVSNAAGSVSSNAASLAVLVAPAISTQPVSQSVVATQSATFTVSATGSGPLSYQWKKNGSVISGATSSSYSIASTATTDSGNYSVSVTNSVSTASSTSATLLVTAPVGTPVPPVVTTLGDTSFEKFSVGANSFYAFAYNPTSTPWTFTGGAGVTGNNSGFTSANPGAPNGSQAAFIQATGSIAQDVVLAAGTYSLSAQVANRANWGDQQTVLVYVDDQLVGTFKSGTAYSLATTKLFTVTSGTHSIDFIGVATTDATLFIDQVSLVSGPVAVGNSSFENTNVGSNSYGAFQYNPATVTGVQDWTFAGNSGLAGDNSGFTSGNPTAPDGSQVAFIQGDNAVVSQSISFSSAGTYTLTVSSAQRGNWNLGAQRVNVYLDSALVGTISPTSTAYQVLTLSVSTTQGAHLLSFKGTVSSDSTLFIDRVSLTSP